MPKPPSKRKKDTSAASSDSTLTDDQDLEENPALATINVTAVEVPELTEQEISDRPPMAMTKARTAGGEHQSSGWILDQVFYYINLNFLPINLS